MFNIYIYIYTHLSLRNLLYNSLSTLYYITLLSLSKWNLSCTHVKHSYNYYIHYYHHRFHCGVHYASAYSPELPLVGVLLPDRPAPLSSNRISILSASSCQSVSSGCGSSFGCGHCSRSNQLAISSSSPHHLSISGVLHGYPSCSLRWPMRYSLYLSCMSSSPSLSLWSLASGLHGSAEAYWSCKVDSLVIRIKHKEFVEPMVKVVEHNHSLL